MTNRERFLTCPYHGITFKSDFEFLEHHKYCSVRVEAGYVDLDNLGCA